MGRARDNNANRAKVSLYIVKRRFKMVRKLSGGGLQESETWGVEDGGDLPTKEKCHDLNQLL